MKKLLLLFIVLNAFYVGAQNSGCQNAAPFCAGSTAVIFPATTSTPQVGAQQGPAYGCLGTQPNPAWYFLQVGASGNLDILIEGQQPGNPNGGQDVDFICWGPFNSLAGVCNSLTAGNIIDCSYSTSFTETLNIANGVSGQYYMVLITNFANVTQNINFAQISGTGNTNCSLLTNSSICAGNNATITASSTSTLVNPTYSLQPGGFTSLTGTFVVTPTVTTSYTVYITGLDQLNAVINQTAVSTVTVNTQPSASPTTTQSTCTSTLNGINLGLSFFPTSPVPGYTVNWTPTPNGITNGTQTVLYGGILPGTYTAVITAQGGCSVTKTVTINPMPLPPVFSLIPAGPLYSVTCAQPTVILDGSDAALTYSWANNVSANMAGQTTNYTALTLGNWTVTALNPASGCISNKTFTVVLNTTPPTSAVNPINQSINCGPGVVATTTGTAISPTINVTHCWYAPNGPAPSCSGGQISIYNPPVGISTLVVTNDINGCSTSKTVQVVTNAGNYPTYQAISSLMTSNAFTLGCGTRSLVTDITVVGATTASGTAVSYTMLPPAYTGTNYTTGNSATYSVNTPGNYVLIIKDNTNFCETRVPLSIVQNTFAPNISAEAVTTRTLTCYTPSATLVGSSLNPYVTYTWKTQTGIPPTTQNASLNVNTTPAGTSVNSATVIDTYTLTVMDLVNTCVSNTILTMYQNTRPPKGAIALSQPALTCVIYSVNLTNISTSGQIPGSFFGNQGIGGQLWQGPPPQTDLSNNSSYSAFTPGTYTLTAIDLNNGCTAKTTTLLVDSRVYPVLNAPKQATLDCGSEISGTQIKVTASTSSIQIIWVTPPGAQTSLDPSKPPTLTLTTNAIGIYKLTVVTLSNSCATSTQIAVVNGELNADFTPDATSGYAPLTVSFANNSRSSSETTATSSITSVWSFGNGTTKTTTTNLSTSATYDQPGTYTVTMFAGKGSCLDTVVKVIHVDIPSKLEVPNVFTPNGDNSNDIFFIKTANLSEITAMIYDRWGNKIYELTTEKGNIAWDGKSQTGKEVPDGTYFYVITAKGKDGQNYDKKGTVSLYR